MKTVLLILIMHVSISGMKAQTITGDWYGNLDVQGKVLHLVFHITQSGDNYVTTFDSPDQGAKGLATDQTTFKNNKLDILASKFGITYTGVFNADKNSVTGTFTQGGGSIPLNLSHEKTTPVNASLTTKPKRPQDPIDFPYKREEVTFQNKGANVELAGTLTIPSSQKPSKIVILITGSGPQNRDEELAPFNHRPFLVWSDWLTRQGIAVLRYDDRGIAKSTGNFSTATSEDFATDVEAAIAYIKSRPDLSHLSIGLVGHSEGGMIAPIVASRNKNVSFIVLLAGPGVPINELMVKQSDDQERLANTPANLALLNHNGAAEVFNFLAKNKNTSNEVLKPELEKIITSNFSKYPQEAFGNTPVNQIVDKQIATYMIPWFRYFIAFNPQDYLTKVQCPVLAVNGTLDSQVSADQNLPAIHKSLQLAGNKNFKTIPLKDLNHLMQKATTGSVTEYNTIEETVDPIALTTVSSWINSLH